ncbi:MAG: hypothetical protein PHV34_07040 [Verrucomicrobiae bacterium]|nr:hypothetical protein [Verrucomicrobiae bacterium]
MNTKPIISFFAQYYDRLIALVVAVFMVGCMGWLVFLVKDLQEEIGRQDAIPTRGADFKPVSTEPFEKTIAILQNPPSWTTNGLATNVNPRLFVAPVMKHYPGEMKIVRYVDPVGKGGVSPEGIPYEWLKKYRFNLFDLVAETDPDNDGFTVREEYHAKSDPTDANSHPDFGMKLRFVRALHEPFMFKLTGRVGSTEQTRFSILRRDGSKNYFVKLNEEIPDKETPGYKVVKFEEKYENRPDPYVKIGGKPVMVKTDVSELTVVKGGEEPVVMVMKQEAVRADLCAQLYFIPDGRTFKANKGMVFSLQDGQYQVLSIKKLDGDKLEVLIQRLNPASQPFLVPNFNPDELKKTPQPNSESQPGLPPGFPGMPTP